jgi:hypothetical protein
MSQEPKPSTSDTLLHALYTNAQQQYFMIMTLTKGVLATKQALEESVPGFKEKFIAANESLKTDPAIVGLDAQLAAMTATLKLIREALGLSPEGFPVEPPPAEPPIQ